MSFALNLSALLLGLVGMLSGYTHGWSDPTTVVAAAVSILLIGLDFWLTLTRLQGGDA